MILQYLDKQGGLVFADVDFPDPEIEAACLAQAATSYQGRIRDTFKRLRHAEAAANTRITPEQAAIGYGDYVTRLFTSPLGSLRIWGRLSTRAELEEKEDAFTLPALDAAHARGWRYGWWYSDVEPDGEPGSAHLADLEKITEAEFDAARARGWRR